MAEPKANAAWDTGNLRKTSEVRDVSFPFASKMVPFILIRQGRVRFARTLGEKRAMLDEVGPDACLLAAWPGEWRQDVFVIDNIAEARLALD